MDGKVNKSELLINVVIRSKPKTLTGLDQKESGQGQGFQSFLTQMTSHRRKDST